MRGKFITFEGSEGCGKSTQSKLLSEYLKEKGFDVLHLREPGGTKISEKIRGILLDPANRAMQPECEVLLYMASRAQIVSEIIRPALEKGKVVICDRFHDSTLAYQGYGLGMDINFIKKLGVFVTGDVKPNLTIFLDLPIRQGLKFRQASKDRIEERPIAYHLRVRSGYLKLAKLEPGRIKVVKVKDSIEGTQEQIRELVDQYVV